MTSRVWEYDRAETTVDAVIHVGGIVLAVAGAIAIIATSVLLTDSQRVAAVSVYAATLVVALSASAAYSMWPVGPMKWKLRKYDHAAIYLLIAGTYTPFTLMMGERGPWLLTFVWIVATVGAILKLVFPGRYPRFSIGLYLGLAWSGVLMVDNLLDSLPMGVFWLLLAGGLIYSAGVPFHLWQKLRFHKAIWHAFVLAAAIIHYNAVFLLIVSAI